MAMPMRSTDGSSPRGRGTLLWLCGIVEGLRFIPAWAGNTCRRTSPASPTSVHPRVGGEHLEQLLVQIRNAGSSPRGRGTREGITPDIRGERFIPAWAGNTVPA